MRGVCLDSLSFHLVVRGNEVALAFEQVGNEGLRGFHALRWDRSLNESIRPVAQPP
jgi:hypothetical protein